MDPLPWDEVGRWTLKILLIALSISVVAYPLLVKRLQIFSFAWSVYRRFTWRMFFEILGMIMYILSSVILLWRIPALRWGWADLVLKRGGNIAITPVIEGMESPSLALHWLVVLFLAVLLLGVPYLAWFEEKIFRKGHYTWPRIILFAILFGLAHVSSGIPLAVCIAVIGVGIFLGYTYRREFQRYRKTRSKKEAIDEALMTTTAYHTLFNTIIIGFATLNLAILVFLETMLWILT